MMAFTSDDQLGLQKQCKAEFFSKMADSCMLEPQHHKKFIATDLTSVVCGLMFHAAKGTLSALEIRRLLENWWSSDVCRISRSPELQGDSASSL